MTKAALILALLSLLPTLATLSVAVVRLYRLWCSGRNGLLRMIAAERVGFEAMRVVKHAIAIFGISLVLLGTERLCGMSAQDLRTWCLAVIAFLLAANSLWSLRGLHRVTELLERQ